MTRGTLEPGGKVILDCCEMLTLEQVVMVREWWANPAARVAYLGDELPIPNRLYGVRINEDGDAV